MEVYRSVRKCIKLASMASHHYLRVSLRSVRPYLGFLVVAEVVGQPGQTVRSWAIAWHSARHSQYLHCECEDREQSVVTHTRIPGAGREEGLLLVTLQVTPLYSVSPISLSQGQAYCRSPHYK